MDKLDIKTKLKIFFFRRKYIKEIEKEIRDSEKDIYTYFKPYDLEDECTNYRELTIINHRRLWGWIAYQTLKKKKKLYKTDYFKHYDIPPNKCPNSFCYLCEYREKHYGLCRTCLLDWDKEKNNLIPTHCSDSYWGDWYRSTNWIKTYYYADKISKLKERTIK